MQQNNIENRRRELEQISTPRLDQMLQEELEKADSDPAEVKAILAELKDREKDLSIEFSDADMLALQRYQSHMEEKTEKPLRKTGWILRAACVAVILSALMITASYEAKAGGFLERLVQWTDSVIEFFNPQSNGSDEQEYMFETDHPGLQQVYDAVVRLGVTDPVVPMWLPDGYSIVFSNTVNSEKKTTLVAVFQNEEKVLNYNVAVYSEKAPNRYQKDETGIQAIEIKGIDHFVVKNNDLWVVVWTKDNIECSISVDCQEDELKKILRSIYDKEDFQ